jgi:hypothetical protein
MSLCTHSGGKDISEMGASGVPIPLVNYVELIRSHKSPYCDTVQFLLRDMETHYLRTGQGSETVYAVNPKILQEEVEKIINDDRLTTVNVCRTILALFMGVTSVKRRTST